MQKVSIGLLLMVVLVMLIVLGAFGIFIIHQFLATGSALSNSTSYMVVGLAFLFILLGLATWLHASST